MKGLRMLPLVAALASVAVPTTALARGGGGGGLVTTYGKEFAKVPQPFNLCAQDVLERRLQLLVAQSPYFPHPHQPSRSRSVPCRRAGCRLAGCHLTGCRLNRKYFFTVETSCGACQGPITSWFPASRPA